MMGQGLPCPSIYGKGGVMEVLTDAELEKRALRGIFMMLKQWDELKGYLSDVLNDFELRLQALEKIHRQKGDTNEKDN